MKNITVLDISKVLEKSFTKNQSKQDWSEISMLYFPKFQRLVSLFHCFDISPIDEHVGEVSGESNFLVVINPFSGEICFKTNITVKMNGSLNIEKLNENICIFFGNCFGGLNVETGEITYYSQDQSEFNDEKEIVCLSVVDSDLLLTYSGNDKFRIYSFSQSAMLKEFKLKIEDDFGESWTISSPTSIFSQSTAIISSKKFKDCFYLCVYSNTYNFWRSMFYGVRLINFNNEEVVASQILNGMDYTRYIREMQIFESNSGEEILIVILYDDKSKIGKIEFYEVSTGYDINELNGSSKNGEDIPSFSCKTLVFEDVHDTDFFQSLFTVDHFVFVGIDWGKLRIYEYSKDSVKEIDSKNIVELPEHVKFKKDETMKSFAVIEKKRDSLTILASRVLEYETMDGEIETMDEEEYVLIDVFNPLFKFTRCFGKEEMDLYLKERIMYIVDHFFSENIEENNDLSEKDGIGCLKIIFSGINSIILPNIFQE